MRFLLDTNALSETFRRSPNPRLLRKIALHEGHFAICAVTWQEIAYGIRRLPEGARKRALSVRLADLRDVLPLPLPYTVDAADWLASERVRLEAKGHTVSCEDGQIAATAWAASLTLVTANTRDFAPFRGIQVVDWTR